MAWTGQNFSVGQLLTAAQMNNLQDDITAAMNQDSGAPAPGTNFITSASQLGTNVVGQSEVKTAYQSIGATNLDFTATGGAYTIGKLLQRESGANATLYSGYSGGAGDSSSYSARFYYSENAATYDGLRLYYINSSPPYDLGDGEVGGFIEACIDANGDIKGLSISPDPAWAYNGPTDQTPSSYRRNSNGTFTPFIKRKDMSKLPMTLKQAMESGDPVAVEEYIDFFRSAEDVEIELTPQMKNSDMDIVPHHLSPKTGETIILLDPVSDLVRKIFDMREEHDKFNDVDFIKNYCSVGNNALNRKGPSGVITVPFSMKLTRG